LRQKQLRSARPFTLLDYGPPMPDADKLTNADLSDLAAAFTFALRYQGRKRVRNADGTHGRRTGEGRAACVNPRTGADHLPD
jgi:hypothetical protein